MLTDQSSTPNSSPHRSRFRPLLLIGIGLIIGGLMAGLFHAIPKLDAQSGSSPLTIQPQTGRVGIGTSSPAYTLDVAGTVNATSLRGDASQLTNLPISSQWTTGGGSIYYTGGNIGVGTTSPGQKLSVAGTVESTSGGFRFPDGTTQTTAYAGGVRMQVFDQSGTFTAPAGISSVLVELWGGGGGGAGTWWDGDIPHHGAGGGGGGYGKGAVSVAPGATYTVTVGAGGTGGALGGSGSSGGTSSFGDLISASGGGGGVYDGPGGAGGGMTSAPINMPGEPGTSGGGVGGRSGKSPHLSQSTGAAKPGLVPGHGGNSTGAAGAGGGGAPGRVIVYW